MALLPQINVGFISLNLNTVIKHLLLYIQRNRELRFSLYGNEHVTVPLMKRLLCELIFVQT